MSNWIKPKYTYAVFDEKNQPVGIVKASSKKEAILSFFPYEVFDTPVALELGKRQGADALFTIFKAWDIHTKSWRVVAWSNLSSASKRRFAS